MTGPADRELPVTANFNWLVIYNYLTFNLPNKFGGYEIALAVSLRGQERGVRGQMEFS